MRGDTPSRVFGKCRLGAAILLVAATTLGVGCKKPEPPTYKAQQVEVVTAQAEGLVLRVQGVAHNPNSMALPVESVSGQITLGGVEVAEVSAKSSVTLAPKADTPMPVEVRAPWPSITKAMAPAMSANPQAPSVPFVVRGSARIKNVPVPVPFEANGEVSKREAILGAFRALPFKPSRPGSVVSPEDSALMSNP